MRTLLSFVLVNMWDKYAYGLYDCEILVNVSALCRVVQKKLHTVECTVILQPFAVESCRFHQNCLKRLLSTSRCKIFISWLNIL